MSNHRYDDRGRHEHGHEGPRERRYSDPSGPRDEHHRGYGHDVGAGDYRPFGSAGPGGDIGGREGPHRYASRSYDDRYGHRGHPDEFGGYREDQGREPPGMREHGLQQSGGGWRWQDDPSDQDYSRSAYEPPGGHYRGRGRGRSRDSSGWRGRDDWNGQRDWGGSESEWSSGRSRSGGWSGAGRDSGHGYGHRAGQWQGSRVGGHGGGIDHRGWDHDQDSGHGGRREPGFRGGFYGQPPKGYTRSDERIREDVCERLTHEDVDAGNVEVSVSEGTVTLTGTVGERWMKHRMEDLADACSGVRDVRNELRVQRNGSQGGQGERQGGQAGSPQAGSDRSGPGAGKGQGSGTTAVAGSRGS